MEWSLTHFWLILALVLSLAELTSGVLLLLALGVAAALTALVAFLGAPFEWQLVAMGVLSGILVPVAIRWIRPRFSPKGWPMAPPVPAWSTAGVITPCSGILTAPPVSRSMAIFTG